MVKYGCSYCREPRDESDLPLLVVTDDGAPHGICDECIESVFVARSLDERMVTREEALP